VDGHSFFFFFFFFDLLDFVLINWSRLDLFWKKKREKNFCVSLIP